MSEEPTSTDIQEQQAPETSRRPRWGIITLIGVILAVIGVALVYLFYQPMYEASAWVQIEATRPYIAFPDSGSSKTFVETQLELIRSPLVLGPVLSQPEIARIPELQENKDPISWLQKQLEVKQVGNSELFKISYTGPNPEDSAGLVNAVVDEYFNLRDRAEATRTQRVIELLEEERERRAEEVYRLRENVRALARHATGKDPFAVQPESDIVVRPRLADLQARLTNAEVERRILEVKIKALEERTAKGQADVPDRMVEEKIEARPLVRQVKQLIDAKRLDLFEAEITSNAEDNKQLVNRLREEIEKAESKLAQLREDLRKDVKAELAIAFAGKQEEELHTLKSQLAGYESMEHLLKERYDKELENVKQPSGDTLELAFAEADLARAEQVFELIAGRVLQLRTEQRAPARVTRLQQATVPTEPVERPYRMMATVSLGGFCLPFVLMGLWIGFARFKAWKKAP